MEEKALTPKQRQQILSELASIDTTFDIMISDFQTKIVKPSLGAPRQERFSWQEALITATFSPSLERWVIAVGHDEQAVAVDVAGAIAAMNDALRTLAREDAEKYGAEAKALSEKSAEFEANMRETGATLLGTARGAEEEGLKLYGKA